MRDIMKNPAAVKADGASKYRYPKPNKPAQFPQERLLRQAHWEAVQRANTDPSPVNRMIAMLVAAAWKKAFMNGGAI